MNNVDLSRFRRTHRQFRFDLLRGISGAEKLAFPPAVRRHVSTRNGFDLEVLTGCPKSIFEILGHVLTYGKSRLAGETTIGEFETVLGDSRRALEQWDATDETYPSSHPDWPLLADAYRHTALLRILRLPDAFVLPCTDEGVRLSVRRVLDVSAQLSWDSPYYKHLLFPIFIAGADAEFGHQHHYVQLCVERVTRTTGFHQPALLQLLQLVWHQRAESDGTQNVPWMEYASHTSPEIRLIIIDTLVADLFHISSATTRLPLFLTKRSLSLNALDLEVGCRRTGQTMLARSVCIERKSSHTASSA